MLNSLFSQKNETRIIVLVGFLVLVAAMIAVLGKTEIVKNDDGSQSIKRSLFGYQIGK